MRNDARPFGGSRDDIRARRPRVVAAAQVAGGGVGCGGERLAGE